MAKVGASGTITQITIPSTQTVTFKIVALTATLPVATRRYTTMELVSEVVHIIWLIYRSNEIEQYQS